MYPKEYKEGGSFPLLYEAFSLKKEIILNDRPVKINLLKEHSAMIRSVFTTLCSIRTNDKARIILAQNCSSKRCKATSFTNLYH